MPSAPMTDIALRASLLFAVARKHRLTGPVSALEDEMASEVSDQLRRQGCAETTDEVLASVSGGVHAADTGDDPALSISAQHYDRIRREFLSEHGLAQAKGRAVWPAGSTTLLRRAGGSWSQALRDAGLGVAERSTDEAFGAAKFAPDQFRSAMRTFQQHAASEGISSSYQNYLQWRKDRMAAGQDDLPSGAALRSFFGSWKAALMETAPKDA